MITTHHHVESCGDHRPHLPHDYVCPGGHASCAGVREWGEYPATMTQMIGLDPCDIRGVNGQATRVWVS